MEGGDMMTKPKHSQQNFTPDHLGEKSDDSWRKQSEENGG